MMDILKNQQQKTTHADPEHNLMALDQMFK